VYVVPYDEQKMTSTTTIRKSYGNRRVFAYAEDYALRSPKQRPNSANVPKKNEEATKLIKYIDDNIIGKNNAFLGPFGRRKVVYCDYAASGRSLQFIEEYISREVLPSYGNTHSTTSITSLQSTNFRQEARDIIKNAANASDADAVIFTGHGCTDALQKLSSA
jgi:selenocysteine lyase/cysteine desulfurase